MEALSRAELLQLLGRAKARSDRDWLMILVAFWHGLRASEVVAITRDDIEDGMLTVARLKGSLRTVQPLVDDPEPLLNERQPLLDYAKESSFSGPIFPVSRQTFWNTLQRHGKAAGIAKRNCHPHILKHSIAMQTIHSAGIEHVRQYLGHKSIASTGAYLKVSDADASSAIRKACGGPVRADRT